MGRLIEQLNAILKELKNLTDVICVDEGPEILHALDDAKRVFLAGAGRSGLAIRAFANRLMHLGKMVHIVGDITTPSIGAEDILFIGSASGETNSLIVNAKKAKTLGAKLILVTANPESSLGILADYKMVINTPSKETHLIQVVQSIQPMGSSFEQLSFLLYDAIVLEWMATLNQTVDSMKARHANLE